MLVKLLYTCSITVRELVRKVFESFMCPSLVSKTRVLALIYGSKKIVLSYERRNQYLYACASSPS